MTHALPPVRQPGHAVAPMFPDRWSPRAFGPAPVGEAAMATLLEAARWAPSASNHQPWRLVWALRGEPAFDRIAAALVPGNRLWAEKAGALIAVTARETLPAPAGGEEGTNRWAAFDTGAAWMSLALQARGLGLVAHAMGGFEPGPLAAAVALPAGHVALAVVAVGHPGRAEDLPEKLRLREVPSGRRALEEISFRGAFPGGNALLG